MPFGWLIYEQSYGAALTIGLLAGLSDLLDGTLARRFGWESQLGARLDAVADKLTVCAAYVTLLLSGLIPLWLALLVLLRDGIILGGALAYRLLIGRVEMAPLPLGKLNLALQLLFCVALLADRVAGGGADTQLILCGYLVALVTALSGVQYIVVWGRKAIGAGTAGGAS